MQPIVRENMGKDSPGLYRLIYRIIWRLSPKYTLYGTENLPEEPCVLVGNHAQMYGPIASELYLPRAHYIWCVGEMMDRKEVPAYAFRDFWSMKPKAVRWSYRLLSHAIARLSEYIFTHAHTIPVYHDVRVMTTIRRSMEKLQEGADIVIFPEKAETYNAILCAFQDEERKRICTELAEAITGLAKALPEHRVVPYLNIPKNQYPKNTDR